MTPAIAALLCERVYESASGSCNDMEYGIFGLSDDDWHQALVIRGTEFNGLFSKFGIIDLVRDLRVMPWYDKRTGWASAGMLRGAKALLKHLEETGDICPRMPYTIAGHSMGGAIALLLAMLMRAKGYEIRHCYTFGAPRVFLNPPYTFPFRTEQYAFGEDPIPDLPPWPYKAGHRLELEAEWEGHSITKYAAHLQELEKEQYEINWAEEL